MDYSYKHIWKVAYPIMVSVLMNQILAMTDTAFLGRYEDGEIALGASALAGLFYTATFMLGMGLATGAQIIMGRRNGAGEWHLVGSIFHHTLVLMLLFAGLLSGLILLLAPVLLPLLVGSDRLISACEEYLYWRLPGFFFAYVAVLFRAFYVGITRTKMLTVNSLIMVVCNFVFNYLLIFGNCGFPRLGIAGAALATVICEAVSMVYFLVYTRWFTDYRKYGLHILPTFHLFQFRRILHLSVWSMVQNSLSFISWFIFFLAVEHIGEMELAVTNIVRNVSSIFFIAVSALAATASTLVSNLLGKGQSQDLFPLMRRTLLLAYAIVLPMLLFAALFPEAVLRIYTFRSDWMAFSIDSLYVLLTSYLLTVPGHILLSSVIGTGHTRKAFQISLIAMLCYVVYVVVVIFPGDVPLPICWFSEHIYSLLTLTFSGWYFVSGRWKHVKV